MEEVFIIGGGVCVSTVAWMTKGMTFSPSPFCREEEREVEVVVEVDNDEAALSSVSCLLPFFFFELFFFFFEAGCSAVVGINWCPGGVITLSMVASVDIASGT